MISNVSENNCPTDWHSMFYGCYFIPNSESTYDVSDANCRIMGAKLAEPVSLVVDTQIALYVKTKLGRDARYWLGINNRDNKDKYKSTFIVKWKSI